MLIEMAKSGIAVIVISSELPEILAISDRIVPCARAASPGDRPRRGDAEILMAMMTALEARRARRAA